MEAISSPHVIAAHGIFRSVARPGSTSVPALTFIDPSHESLPALVHAVRSQSDLIFLDRSRHGLDQIIMRLSERGRVDSVHIVADVICGELNLCGRAHALRALRQSAPDLARLGRSIAPSGYILIGAGRDPDGRSLRFLRMFAEFAGVPVRVWTERGVLDI